LTLSHHINKKKFAKTNNLVFAGNEVFVKCQAHEGGFNPKTPTCVRPCSILTH